MKRVEFIYNRLLELLQIINNISRILLWFHVLAHKIILYLTAFCDCLLLHIHIRCYPSVTARSDRRYSATSTDDKIDKIVCL